jgi:hypothetical protein
MRIARIESLSSRRNIHCENRSTVPAKAECIAQSESRRLTPNVCLLTTMVRTSVSCHSLPIITLILICGTLFGDQPTSSGDSPHKKLVRLVIEPSSVTLYGAGGSQQLIVSGFYADGQEADVTRQARFEISDEKVIRLGEKPGLMIALADGASEVRAFLEGLSASASVRAKNATLKRQLSFTRDIAPILTMGGCTGSNCHGSLHGKADFKLSLFGYEPSLDYEAITKASNGRRINREKPEDSLVLLKPTFAVPHGGGLRFDEGSLEYNALLEWIKSGTPYESETSPSLATLEVFPKERTLTGLDQKQQLVVRATYSDGISEDVTRKVQYTATDPAVVIVNKSGEVTSHSAGETAIMIRTLGQAIVSHLTVVEKPPLSSYPKVAIHNSIDEQVFQKLRRLNIIPSDLSSDSDFLRRIYLDVVGVTPTEEEVKAFLSSKATDKRQRLIDQLLERPEYADVWANKFDDIFRVGFNDSGVKGGRQYHEFILNFLRKNRPYDDFARELLTSGGSHFWNGPANFYFIAIGVPPEDLAVHVSQTMLGIRLECARCHNHPFEKWTLDDFYGFASFFKRVATKEVYSNDEDAIVIKDKGEVRHPKTKQLMSPKLLNGPILQESPDEDIRERLASWITSPENPWFARAIVNRIWKTYMGRGIVEPVDDFRITNPPSNPELLDALAKEFCDHNFDFKHIVRTVLSSRTYQLCSATNNTNKADYLNYSHYYVRRLSAEQMIDSIVDVTGVPEKFPGNPPEARAMTIPVRAPTYFLKTFGRIDDRMQICERNNQPDMAQAMHMISGDTIQSKIRSKRSDLAKWLADPALSDRQIVSRIFRRAFARDPEPGELSKPLELIASIAGTVDSAVARREVFEDLMWAVLNSSEFVFNH